MDTQVADSLLGLLIDGRYRIRGRVARGGMATVYTATDERLERTVALKVIHPSQAHDNRFLERFTDEAKTIARLSHPNVVGVYDQGTYAGRPYLVMEYVRGRTLRSILTERRRLNPPEALAILEQSLAAIAAAHRAGLVHRDVKPENILVTEAPSGGAGNLIDGVVKVADFGLARAVEASADDAAGSRLLATAAYVAPELVSEGHADARADVYAAGIVLFEMLTGRVPYDGDKPVEVAWQHVDRDVPPPSKIVAGLPTMLDDLVAHATRRDPGARPTDAGALLAEVQLVHDDLGSANATTAVMRPVAAPTVAVPRVQPSERPVWARLPQSRPAGRPGRRRAAPSSSGWSDRLGRVGRDTVASRGGRVVLVAAVLLTLALVAGVGWWFGVGRYTVAPSLVSMPRAEAEAQASRAGLEVAYADGRYDEEVTKDVVVAQDPPAKGRILKGGTVTLVLSLGPERYPVPDIVGKEYDVAVLALEKAKLDIHRGPDAFSDDIPKGSVLAVKPKEGQVVKPGTKVTVTVSKGKAPIEVPDVMNKNITEARQILAQLGLRPIEEYKDSDKPQGTVIGQSPADGTGVDTGAEIKLQVSNGPQMVAVPDVTSAQNVPCRQAEQILHDAGLAPQLQGDPELVARQQAPAPNTPVPPGSGVVVWCG
jgi:serine/threonine protein kinase/beta-lactam-binding protein with PASTA domain